MDVRQIHHEPALALLSDDLQDELKALKDTAAAQRQVLHGGIMGHTIARDYGPDV